MLVWIWLKKVWAWLKKNWKYILFPVGILIAVLTLLGRRKQTVVAPELVGSEEVRQRADEEADKQLKEAEEDHSERLKRIELEHAETLEIMTKEQAERYLELKENPDELNSFLLQVGEEARENSR